MSKRSHHLGEGSKKILFFFFAAGALHLLVKYSEINFLVTGAEPFRGDIISTTQYGLDVTFHQDSVTIIMISVSSFFSSF